MAFFGFPDQEITVPADAAFDPATLADVPFDSLETPLMIVHN